MKLNEQKFIVFHLLRGKRETTCKNHYSRRRPNSLDLKKMFNAKKRSFYDMSTFIIRLSKIETHLLLPFRFLALNC